MSKPRPRIASDIAEHSMCQPGRVRHVRGGHLDGELFARPSELLRGRVDLVVDIRNIRYEDHGMTLMDEETLHQREDHEGAGVAHMDAPVDGRAAHVDPDRFS